MKGNCCGGSCPSLVNSVFNGLTDQQRCSVKSQGLTVNFRKGQKIISQGSDSEGLFCIKDGVVKLSLEAPHGDQITVKLLAGKGTIAHESLGSKSYLYTATCLSDTSACYFPKSIIEKAVTTFPTVSRNVCNLIKDDTKQLAQVVLSLRSKSVTQRVAEILIMLLNTFGKDNEGYINVELTKEEISNLVGSSVESVFRNLSEFKSNGLLQIHNKKVSILNEQRLRTLGKIFNN